MEKPEKIKLTKEEWEKSKQYINKIYKTAEEKAIGTGTDVINELIRRGKNPTPGIENKLRELVIQPVFESAKDKTHMFTEFLKQTQDTESAIMLTECAESVIRDSKEMVQMNDAAHCPYAGIRITGKNGAVYNSNGAGIGMFRSAEAAVVLEPEDYE